MSESIKTIVSATKRISIRDEALLSNAHGCTVANQR